MSYSKEIDWNDGSGDKLYFSAPASEGNQTVEVSSDANAGDERTKTVNFVAAGVAPQPLTIVQLGSGAAFDDWVKDGDTHLWINIVNDYQLDQEIRIRMIGTIDWGDGSAKDSVNVTSATTFTHRYSEKGKYRIDLHPTSGTFTLGGASSNYSVMGSRTNSSQFRTSVLYQAELGSSRIVTSSSYIFSYCYGLRRVYFPKNITTFSSCTFYNCYGLTEVIFEDASKITSATLTSNFISCYALQKLSPLDFNGGTAITTITRYCHSLTEFWIPRTVTSLAANSLGAMYGLKILHCLPTSPPSAADSTVFSNLPSGCEIRVPFGSLASYSSASQWSSKSSQMVEAGLVTKTLTRVSSSNKEPMIAKNASYTTTLEADSGYTLGTVTVKMGGVDITNTAYSNGVVNIADVTGNIEITATAS